MYALANCAVFTGTGIVYDQAVLVEGDRVAELVSVDALPDGVAIHDLQGLSVAPGFIDLQVNGGGDVLFNDSPTVDAIRTICQAHRKFGTTDLLPTFATGPDSAMMEAVEAVRSARAERLPGVLGIHLEGPFLNPEKAGAHEKSLMRAMTEEDLRLLPSFTDGAVVLLTVAPEVVPGELLQRLSANGTLISAGHSNATRAQIADAFSKGVSCATHLFNAMRSMESREPGVVGAALEDEGSWCGVIVDGQHVHFGTVRVAWRAKAARKMFLVTDAMPPVGGERRNFRLGPDDVSVKEGRCQLEDGRLAGSVLDMATAVRNCIQYVGIPTDEALRMASTYPAEFARVADHLGQIAPGYRANLVVFDNEINVHAVVIRGEYIEQPAL